MPNFLVTANSVLSNICVPYARYIKGYRHPVVNFNIQWHDTVENRLLLCPVDQKSTFIGWYIDNKVIMGNKIKKLKFFNYPSKWVATNGNVYSLATTAITMSMDHLPAITVHEPKKG